MHIVTDGKTASFLWLNNIPLWISIYLYLTYSLSIHPLTFHCFCVLAIVNFASMNTGVQRPFWDSDFISFREIPRSGMTGLYVISIFNFLRKYLLFFTVATPIYIPNNSAQAFPFVHMLTNTYDFLSFWNWPFWQGWGGLDSYFPDD